MLVVVLFHQDLLIKIRISQKLVASYVWQTFSKHYCNSFRRLPMLKICKNKILHQDFLAQQFREQLLLSISQIKLFCREASDFQTGRQAQKFAERLDEEIDEHVQVTLTDILNKYSQYNEEVKRVDKPLGNINDETVNKFRSEVQIIEEKTGYDPDEAILDTFDSAMWERGNVMRSFLIHCLDKFGPLPELKLMKKFVEELEQKYEKTFVKGEDPQMDAEYMNKIKNMARTLNKQDYVSENYEKFKLQAVHDRLLKAEMRAKIAFQRELARQLGVGESQILQMFRDKGLDFDQEFRRAYEQASKATKKQSENTD
eukprot:TRINITY_DN6011_c0_g1_i2.p1 TRINITY_DN6011_c0_g1~~TRINITY_DN6011_c0_g1_i2.p1  ORF type:complete len:314 (-),score=27.76 TRINITY_DN6011_c0_g1_i2:437-1378(-)